MAQIDLIKIDPSEFVISELIENDKLVSTYYLNGNDGKFDGKFYTYQGRLYSIDDQGNIGYEIRIGEDVLYKHMSGRYVVVANSRNRLIRSEKRLKEIVLGGK